MLRLRPRAPADQGDIAEKAVQVALGKRTLQELAPDERRQVDILAKAVTVGSSWTRPNAQSGTVQQLMRGRPVSVQTVAERAAAALAPGSNITPIDIQAALMSQGVDWVQPFAPGTPLTPYYGYNRKPRERDYPVGRNITTETRPGRIPYQTLRQLHDSYDVAQICTRHAIQDLRSMRIRFEVMDGYEENPIRELRAAKEFWANPDRQIDMETGKAVPRTGNTLKNWLCKHAYDVWRFDAGSLYRQRDRAGRLISLPVPDGTLFAPMLDYFGTNPYGEAPAFQQFIQGIPWDWIRWEDLLYVPMWPHTEDPFGIAPIETVLTNANTDMRLQLYFLQFFTAGQVPEAFAIAPEDQSDPDALADWQETYNDWTYGDQSERWGLRWLPHGTELEWYKPQQFDPEIAEYVMRRTVAAFMMTPQDLGFTSDVNRATADTQMDTQFRISSLPNVSYYEDMLDAITQQDLGLPVQLRFDTGREKRDRYTEAQALQLYWSMGAISSDEIRSKTLGMATNIEEGVPRAIYDQRLGIIPLSHVIGISGDVDPLTGAPRPGTVPRIPYVEPGAPGTNPQTDQGQIGPNPPAGPGTQGTQYDDNAAANRRRGNQPPSGAGPKDPTKVYPKPLYRPASSVPAPDSKPGLLPGTKPAARRTRSASVRGRPDQGTASRRALKEVTAGITTATAVAGAPAVQEDEDEREDLKRWKSQSLKRVKKGQSPRHYEDSAIREHVYDAVWADLWKATSPEGVVEAFLKAKEEDEGPEVAGIALVAADTGRVLLVQRWDED